MKAILFLLSVAAFGQMVDYDTQILNRPAYTTVGMNFRAVSFTAPVTGGTYTTFTFSKCPTGVSGLNMGPSLSITGAANNGLGLIRITTAASGVLTGQRVTITGVGGVTAANGNWEIVKVSQTTFDLVNSTFSGVYTSGGAARQNIHSLYISGGVGTAEAVYIGGGTCQSGGGGSGTITAYAANSHSGTYNITSATGGTMEAIWAQTGVRRRVFISGRGTTLHGPIWITTDYGLDLFGGGMLNTVVSRASDYTGDLIFIDASSSSLNTVHDMWLYSQYMNGAPGSAGIRMQNITCCGALIQNVKIWDEINGVVIDASDDITLSNVRYQQTNALAKPENGLRVTEGSMSYGAASSNIFVYGGTFETGEGYTVGRFAVSNAVNNGAGLIRLTIASSTFTTGSKVTVSGVTGTTEANGDWTVNVINATTIDLVGSTFANAYVSGGVTVYTNVLENGILVESGDGMVIDGVYMRGIHGLFVNPAVTLSGILVTDAVIDRCRNNAIGVAATVSTAQGQINVKGSWITGNYTPGQPLVIVDMTNITTGRFIFDDNDVAGSYGAGFQVINGKNVKIQDNTIVSSDLGATGAGAIEILTAGTGLQIHDNNIFDLPSFGSTTQYGLILNANITNSDIHNDNIGTMQGASVLYQAGTNSNFKVTGLTTVEGIPSTATGASVAYPTNLPPVWQITGGGTVSRITGGWPGLKIQVITGGATTFNTGGANPGDFARSITSSAAQLITMEMLSDGKWYF